MMLATLLAAGIYPDGHWDYSTKLFMYIDLTRNNIR